MFGWLDRVSLVSGPLPVIVVVLGILGAGWLCADRRRWFLRWALPLSIVGAAAMTAALYVIVEHVWRPFPDPVEKPVYLWIGVGLWAVLLLVPRIVAGRRWMIPVSVLAAATVVLVAAVQINQVFYAYPTVGTALGLPDPDRIDFAEVPPPTGPVVTGRPLEDAWAPQVPGGMPDSGRYASAPIPGEMSGFAARDAVVYLPPSYFVSPRPLLPVLVLLAGQPGSPEDWLNGGKLAATMDAFARAHHGLAPVVVVPDGTGSQLANPLCMNSKLGNVATYLAVDVPAWTRSHLQVDPDPRSWAVAGLSYGGTCALQLATNYPQVYPTFLDLSGQEEPTLGDRQRTVDEAFGGDEAAFVAANPMDLMKTRRYPDTAGIIVMGDRDDAYRGGAKKVFEAAKNAGMDVQYVEVPGAHSFSVWSTGLREELDWLAKRMGLIS
ncbi:S-formylglutathione hydrolase FrmB [Rhodococcus sp. AG1013]|uniref:alpha/beta hydrolase n=1 Tax=Rhodococcus sp. AG1013 TaxID=2183996 RepID=UPI000E0B034C|nr:alpha/beta hydrolase-fold protein [Rhodococcus sp. AG1013]RDI18026.1 S-formylglutathione hydrolase FrmB [Rhodococcus sp. AG1013]